jgi:hypothetical protein
MWTRLKYVVTGLGAKRQENRVRFPAWEDNFIFITVSQWRLGPSHLPLQWVMETSFLGVKPSGLEDGHSPPPVTVPRIRRCATIFPLFHMSSIQKRGNFTYSVSVCVCVCVCNEREKFSLVFIIIKQRKKMVQKYCPNLLMYNWPRLRYLRN